MTKLNIVFLEKITNKKIEAIYNSCFDEVLRGKYSFTIEDTEDTKIKNVYIAKTSEETDTEFLDINKFTTELVFTYKVKEITTSEVEVESQNV